MHQSYGLQIFSDSSDIYSTKCFLFSPKCTQIRERLGLRPRPPLGSLQRSPRPPSWIWLGSRRAPTENIWSNPPFRNPGYGPEFVFVTRSESISYKWLYEQWGELVRWTWNRTTSACRAVCQSSFEHPLSIDRHLANKLISNPLVYR